MNTRTLPRTKACQECGAGNNAGNTVCWMCRADVTNSPEVEFADWAKVPEDRSRVVREWLGTIGVFLSGGIVVGACLFQGSIGAVFFGILWIAALVIIFGYRPIIRVSPDYLPVANLESGDVNPYTPPLADSLPARPTASRSVWESIREALLILGLVALILIAAFIALATACFAIIQNVVY